MWFFMRTACFAILLLFASATKAEIFMGITPATSLSDLKQKFPNAIFMDENPAWPEDNEKMVSIKGDGIEGEILAHLINHKYSWVEEFKSKDCGDEKNKESHDCVMLKKMLALSDDDSCYVWRIRHLPPEATKTNTLIKKYGPPDSVAVDKEFGKFACWEKGICAFISSKELLDQSYIGVVLYIFTDDDAEILAN